MVEGCNPPKKLKQGQIKHSNKAFTVVAKSSTTNITSGRNSAHCLPGSQRKCAHTLDLLMWGNQHVDRLNDKLKKTKNVLRFTSLLCTPVRSNAVSLKLFDSWSITSSHHLPVCAYIQNFSCYKATVPQQGQQNDTYCICFTYCAL